MRKKNFDVAALQNKQNDNINISSAKSVTSLWCYVYIENFSLQVVSGTQYRTKPSILHEYKNGKATIVQLNSIAAELGFYVGMALSIASDLPVRLYNRDRRKEQEIKKKFFKNLNNFSPLVVNESSDGILVEIGGSTKLFGGEKKIFNLIRKGLQNHKYLLKIAAAPTPYAAIVMAKSGLQKNIWSVDNLNSIVSGIDLNYLGLQEKDLKKFLSLGVKTLGDVYRLPRAGLLKRFSSDVLKKIDQLYGRETDLSRIRIHDDFFVKLIDIESLNNISSFENYMRLILYDLNIFLKKRTAKTKLLRWFFFFNQSHKEVTIELNEATSSPEFLLNETKKKVEKILLNATLERIGLYVKEIIVYSFHTKDLFLSKSKEMSKNSDKYVKNITSKYGTNIVYKILKRPSYIPERTYNICDPLCDPKKNIFTKGVSFRVRQKQYRPTWLLQRPMRLKIRSGRIEFEGTLEIISSRERLVSGWWDGDEVARDYFVAKNSDHRLFWIFKDLKNDKKWYLHGIFD